MNFDLIKTIVSHSLSTLVRHGLVVFGVWLSNNHIPGLSADAQSQLTDTIVGSIVAGIGLLWSVYRSHKLGANQGTPVIALGLSLSLFWMGCATIASFDQNSLDAAKKLKYQSLQLIAHASEKPDAYQEQIKSLQADLAFEIAYEKGKGSKNLASEKQWETLASPDHLLGRFLKDWSAGKQFSPAFIDEDSKIIADVFDSIAELESAKTNL